MGCGASRPEDGGMLAFPPRLRPLFLHRWEDIRLRRHSRALKPSLSKKELLLGSEDDENNSSSHTNGFKTAPVTPEKKKDSSKTDGLDKNGSDKREDHKKGDAIKVDEEDEEEKFYTDFENDDDDRMIGRDGYLGSPSFRVYFNDDDKRENGDDDREHLNGKIGTSKAFASSDDNASCDEIASSKESSEGSKKTKRGRKRKSFRKVFPRGGHVKNLLNVTSCYTPSPRPTSHDHGHGHGHTESSPLPGKTCAP